MDQEKLEWMDSKAKEMAFFEKKRAQVKRACLHCRKAHSSCSNERPCKRCSIKGLKCEDPPLPENLKQNFTFLSHKSPVSSFDSPSTFQIQLEQEFHHKRKDHDKRSSLDFDGSILSLLCHPPENRERENHDHIPVKRKWATFSEGSFSGQAISRWNLKGKLIGCNPEFCELIQRPIEQLKDFDFQQLFPCSSSELLQEIKQELRAGALKSKKILKAPWITGKGTVTLVRSSFELLSSSSQFPSPSIVMNSDLAE